MGFKEGVDVAKVHAFRALIAKMREFDTLIDSGQITPDEAMAAVKAHLAAPAMPQKKEKV
jgi:hypothetical protein